MKLGRWLKVDLSCGTLVRVGAVEVLHSPGALWHLDEWAFGRQACEEGCWLLDVGPVLLTWYAQGHGVDDRDGHFVPPEPLCACGHTRELHRPPAEAKTVADRLTAPGACRACWATAGLGCRRFRLPMEGPS
jgi:hypothetical protein